ncbi:hypothetical protein GCM10010399_14240 [Dactylosporangium fulvum]|uniref:Uncharacterized protein n=1 Tax=Dactylosporangium fulvum TaxID=53359 RepID=A0ABY5W572_9ACTN|nr:hypothetical protein [Dactylosporangium fulvum]UWP85158.1 hypothetical protein Dfulv_13380 [Dactylosporangium fulvum]
MTHLEHALREGWNSACQLYGHLHAGGDLAALPPGTVRLNPDEVPYGDALLGYARFYGTTVTYQQSSTLLLGSAAFVAAGLAANAIANSSARHRAQAQAAVQWRDHATVRTILTNRRLLCDYRGRWLSFWHEGVVELQGDVARWLFVLRYQVGDPIMLHGPAAPWFAVSVAHLVYGRPGLRLPGLAALPRSIAEAAARQQRAIGPA